MGLPRWLHRAYCRLYSRFEGGEFHFSEACEVLGCGEQRARVVLSRLRGSGYLDVLCRVEGGRRLYHLAGPRDMVVLCGWGVDVARIPEGARPILRPYLADIFSRLGERVVSIALYGSFARGEERPESDIDLLMVLDGYEWGGIAPSGEALRLTQRLLELRGVYHTIQPLPLTREQARHHRPLYLDMVEDAIILYDRELFLTGVLGAVRERLRSLGAERRRLPDGSWYWVLKPSVREGEVIEV